jgi:hypothetical protein
MRRLFVGESADELIQTDGPRVPVEVGVEVLGKGFQKLVTEVLQVLGRDFPVGVPGLDVRDESVESRLVVRGGDDHRQTVERALGERLELGRVDVVPRYFLTRSRAFGYALKMLL